MNSRYFLGANSSEGFYSLYSGFCRGVGDYLSIIKGGPGTGKSGFMRRIGQAAEQAGLDVEYVLCSGDSASLDGVYIPTLHRGWMDGTSPHSAEPNFFGIDGDYIDLSRFCKTPLTGMKAIEAEKLYRGYKSQYTKAYGFLHAASVLKETGSKELTAEEKHLTERNISSVLPGRKRKNTDGKATCRFLRSLSGDGETVLEDEIEKKCEKIYTLFGGYRATDYALRFLTREALLRGLSPIVCLSPLEPNVYEAVLLRETRTAVTDRHYTVSQAKSIPLPAEEIIPAEYAGQEKALMSDAFSCLAEAKKQHDALEKYYMEVMDFNALTEFTGNYITELFG